MSIPLAALSICGVRKLLSLTRKQLLPAIGLHYCADCIASQSRSHAPLVYASDAHALLPAYLMNGER